MTFWIPKKKDFWQDKSSALDALDYAHPIAPKITDLFTFKSLHGAITHAPIDLINGCELTGGMLSGDGVNDYTDVTLSSDMPIGSDKRWYAGVVTIGEFNASVGSVIWSHGDGDVGAQSVILFAENNAISVGFGGHRVITPKSTLAVGQKIHVVIQNTGTTSGSTNIYIGGIKQTLTTEAGSSLTLNTSSEFRFFDDFAGGGNYGKHDIELFFCGKGNLSDGVIYDLAQNHYQILAHRKTYFPLGAAGGAGAALAGDAAGQATATAEATTGIPLAGAMLSVATSNGVISTGINIGGAASAISLLDGNIDTEIRVSVAAIIEALAQAGLDTQTLFEAAAAGQADASGTLQSDAAALEGDATGVAQGSADLSASGALLAAVANAIADGNATITIAITMQGDALAEALAQAGLTVGGSGLEGDASAVADALAVMLTQINMIGGGSAVVTSLGGIDTILQMQGAAASASNMLGGLNTSITVEAAAFINALAQAGLTTAGGGLEGDAGAVADANAVLKIGVSFDGDAVGVAVAAGNLTAGAIDIPTIPRWMATAGKRNWTVEDKRSWEVCA